MPKLRPIEIPQDRPPQKRPISARATGRRFDAFTGGDVAELQLYDEIGAFGVSAAAFADRLKAVAAERIRLRINSPGGDVFDGMTIFNDLLQHTAKVEVQIVGLAASAASVVAMAGDRIEIADNAFLMIHNAWSLSAGNRKEMRRMADVLEKIDAALAETYAARTGQPIARIEEMMAAETWLSAEEAVELGFADAVMSAPETVSARFDLSIFDHPPDALAFDDQSRLTLKTRQDAESFLTAHCGLTRGQARGLIATVRGQPVELETLEQVAAVVVEGAEASAAAIRNLKPNP